ncbi:MAG TPA: CRISPR-associated protein Cas4 [Roseiflexaceae bacterium]|nr:CRISPR-associated protein Cas4 [Roseiflexaceae bacterium]
MDEPAIEGTAGAAEIGADEVLISAIEHYSYCPRQCALIHVEQTYDENVYTIRGRLAHERVDSGADAPQRGVLTLRAIPLWSERHGLRGKADLVEWRDGRPYPVEHKVGRRHGPHADLQLCAQALCLEEMLEVEVPRGAVYYAAVRKRHEVLFDQALRARTEEVIRAVRAQIAGQTLPPAPNDARCPNCSLRNACLPGVVEQRARLRGLQQSLFVPLALADREE